jgi:hypothetical protein
MNDSISQIYGEKSSPELLKSDLNAKSQSKSHQTKVESVTPMTIADRRHT